jgi:hypothetical protein
MRNLQESMPVIYKRGGQKYNFIAEALNGCFSVKAIDKLARKCSFINNLNYILSYLEVDIDNPDFCDSTWILNDALAKDCFNKMKRLFRDNEALTDLQNYLDLDREEGEWENIYSQDDS